MDEQIEVLRSELDILKNKFLYIEKMSRTSSGGFEKKVLIFVNNSIKLRIDANKNHVRPHIHVDYGKYFHAASISIDTSELLVGSIPNAYLKEIQNWINKNKANLIAIWNALRASENPENYILRLQSS